MIGIRQEHNQRQNKWLPNPAVIWFHEIVYEENYRERRWSWPQIAVVVFIAVALIGAFVPTFSHVAPRANRAAAMGNCKQIIIALRIYADEHGGAYPDVHDSVPMTSNQAFRLLFREGVLDDERIFGCKASQFIPDMSIGGPPEYPEALEAGENHWAMTKGVTEKSRADMPLVFENPVLANWPPAWHADAAGKLVKGRVWPGGKITIGFNDSSIRMIKLESAKGANVTPARDADGKDVFTRAALKMEILDIKK